MLCFSKRERRCLNCATVNLDNLEQVYPFRRYWKCKKCSFQFCTSCYADHSKGQGTCCSSLCMDLVPGALIQNHNWDFSKYARSLFGEITITILLTSISPLLFLVTWLHFLYTKLCPLKFRCCSCNCLLFVLLLPLWLGALIGFGLIADLLASAILYVLCVVYLLRVTYNVIKRSN